MSLNCSSGSETYGRRTPQFICLDPTKERMNEVQWSRWKDDDSGGDDEDVCSGDGCCCVEVEDDMEDDVNCDCDCGCDCDDGKWLSAVVDTIDCDVNVNDVMDPSSSRMELSKEDSDKSDASSFVCEDDKAEEGERRIGTYNRIELDRNDIRCFGLPIFIFDALDFIELFLNLVFFCIFCIFLCLYNINVQSYFCIVIMILYYILSVLYLNFHCFKECNTMMIHQLNV